MCRRFEFAFEGATLRGRLLRPDGGGQRHPLVVMAHGFSATSTGMVADRFADALCSAGFAVLLYDHLGFGLSDGSPRGVIDPFVQARGYRAALDSALELPGIDRDRVAVWGDSLSGAEAIVVAAVDCRVKAVVAQVPAMGREAPPSDPDGRLFEFTCRPFLEVGASPGYGTEVLGPMPVVSSDQLGTPSLLTPITAFRWFIEYGGRHGSHWCNEASLVVPTGPAMWRPALAAPLVRVPTMVVLAPEDEIPGASPEIARLAFERIPAPKELCAIEGGHFGLLRYPGELFERVAHAQADFLLQHLRDPEASAGASTNHQHARRAE